MSNQAIKVSIVVPTFRRPDVLRQTLAALVKLDYPRENYEIIVVDDGSEDATPQVVEAFQSEFANLIYHSQPNSGVATARNSGAKIARGEILIFNDDDIVAEASVIERHLRNLAEFGKCLINGHWEFTPEMTSYLENTPFGQFRLQTEVWVKTAIERKSLRENCYEPSGVTACHLGVRREDFWQIGGFDEQFPYAGCEDQEFSMRASQKGYKFIYDNDIRLWHNDHRLNLQQFGERQRRGAITKVLLAVKYPVEVGNHSMIVENDRLKSGDSLKITTKKIIKTICANTVALNILLAAVAALEKKWSRSFLLPPLYNSICGFYIFRGIRQGIARFGEPRVSDQTGEDTQKGNLKKYAES